MTFTPDKVPCGDNMDDLVIVLPRSSSIAGPGTPHHFHLPDLETERPRLLRECFPCLELGHPKPLAPGLCQAFQKNDPSQLLSPS